MSELIENLGGSMFIHNAIDYDYCIEAAIMSLLDICGEVVVLDAESTDGTMDLLKELEKRHDRLKIHKNCFWECAKDYKRLALLANTAISLLHPKCTWHFMLQADEVLHENSFQAIRDTIIKYDWNENIFTQAFRVRRINVYGNFGLKVKYTSQRRPCGDNIIRLARREFTASGDGESIHHDYGNPETIDKIMIYHYGYMRKPDMLLEKGINMTTWFGKGTSQMLVDMKAGDGWNPYAIIPRSELDPIPWPHPKYIRKWIEERKEYYADKKELQGLQA